jgi:NAD(P)-dependent dehydrogenase (short-subunit alcohol dehydrogenase family)
VDLRASNSWLLKLHEVSTPEVAEVFAVNTLAPFVLNSKLVPIMGRMGRAGRREEAGERPAAGARGGEDDAGGAEAAGGAGSAGADDDDDADGDADDDAERPAFIVNVSAMEGKFYRHKMPSHPHTNMAKVSGVRVLVRAEQRTPKVPTAKVRRAEPLARPPPRTRA